MRTVREIQGSPTDERPPHWREEVTGLAVPVEVTSDCEWYHAELGMVELGPVQVTSVLTAPCTVHRPSRLIRRSDPGLFQLNLIWSGGNVLDQDRSQTPVASNEMVLYDTSRPFRIAARPTAPNSVVQGAGIMFPRTLLPLTPAQVNRFTATRLSAREGVGTLLSEFVARLLHDPEQYQTDDAIRLGTVLVDLLAALLAQELDGDCALPADTRQRTLLLSVQAFIHQNLGDPELSPSLIASAHNISARSLHRLFQPQGSTVAEWVRARRLERCRRDLADPSLSHRPIHAIAARWGLTDPAHFSRLFRAAYGVSPQDYRHQHRRPGGSRVHLSLPAVPR
ncbi:hypothetical protein AQ490_15840 [Wenjunlia vitaminophila]|uniref:HTH araC/xylS-type domain-containing protein n=1 Tax=Wenjunlia vitaminophila TaxID=76728 RepID=A0A0T6LWV3_WENVI|nr:helix-turn-helix domain-containing protein [Wenjunlia vitaminophila]KRV50541.1 hypothetical protein AQ490_15840 [Wenjunlia vitaminophila]